MINNRKWMPILFGLAISSSTEGYARCKLPWDGSSIDNARIYIEKSSDIVALGRVLRNAGSSSGNPSLIKLIVEIKRPTTGRPAETILVDQGRISSRLSKEGTVVLIAAQRDQKDSRRYRLNECLELAIANVGEDALIDVLFAQRTTFRRGQ